MFGKKTKEEETYKYPNAELMLAVMRDEYSNEQDRKKI